MTQEDTAYGDAIMRKIIIRLMPFLLILYIMNYIDRVNLGFAALTMNADLGITPAVYGLISGIFFIGYIAFEYPSNRLMERYGARVWIPRILISWGIVVVLLAFARSAYDIGILRILLGIAEAGFYPGMIFYLSLWLRCKDLAKCLSYIFSAQIFALIIGAPLSTLILDHITWFDMASWRWLFILEGLPAIILGIVSYQYLTNRPEEATWLDTKEKQWLIQTLKEEKRPECIHTPRKVTWFFRQAWFNRFWIAYFLEMCAGYSMIFWLPQIIHSLQFTSSHTMVGCISAIPYLGSLVGMVLIARHSDKTNERKYHLIFAWLLAGAGFLGEAFAGDPVTSLLCITIAMMGIYAGLPIFWAIVTERMGQIDSSGGIALLNAIATSGGFFGPLLMGIFVSGSGQMDAIPALVTYGGFMIIAVILVTWNFQNWEHSITQK